MINLTLQHLLKIRSNQGLDFPPNSQLVYRCLITYIKSGGGGDLNFVPIFLREAMSVQAMKPLPSKHCQWNPQYILENNYETGNVIVWSDSSGLSLSDKGISSLSI